MELLTIRDMSVSIATAARKLPKNMRPEVHSLYKFFDGKPDKLSEAQRRRIADIIREDSEAVINYLLNS